MSTLSHKPVPSFEAWFFGQAFADKLNARDAAAAAPAPASTWPDWVDADVWELGPDDGQGDDEDGHHHEPAPFEPGPAEAAFYLGFTLGLECEPAADPRGVSPFVARSFRAGWVAGDREQVRDLERWLDSLPEPDWDSMYPDFDPLHPIERAEAGPMVRHHDA